ncbi:YbjN domain-containing protein [Pelagerythrobacter marensis]|uniref:YbjN domain-containing protein n=1 Tax=Pelagerythrobacter marensis TaxID=543877 RepID=A0A0G3X8B0_9SPHN|nr:YbjN domain-containing protein [Pelagerythrobacter marensis]AKM06866.1 hypothetical protein AM2010_786 [Pelagerythrobacter marensis]
MRNLFKLATAAAFAAGGLSLAAPASAQTYSAGRVIEAVTTSDLKAIVTSLDHEVVAEGDYGNVSISARSDTGTNYLVIGTACNVGDVAGCQGVMLQVRFDADPDITTDALIQANLTQAAVNTWRDPSGTIGVTRYVVLDHGVTMANLRENVLVLLSLTPSVVQTLLGE